jgi:hypothetical protein
MLHPTELMYNNGRVQSFVENKLFVSLYFSTKFPIAMVYVHFKENY